MFLGTFHLETNVEIEPFYGNMVSPELFSFAYKSEVRVLIGGRRGDLKFEKTCCESALLDAPMVDKTLKSDL